MEYISAKEIAALWQISSRRVNNLIREGRIQGCKKVGNSWLIPANAKKPVDKRQAASTTKEELPFRFPALINKGIDEYDPPLTEEERQIYYGSAHFFECSFDECEEILVPLFQNTDSYTIKSICVYFLTLCSFAKGDYSKAKYYVSQMMFILSNDFPYYREMLILMYETSTYFEEAKSFFNELTLENKYEYHPSALPYLMAFTTYVDFMSHIKNQTSPDPSIYEYNCQFIEHAGHYIEAQSIHIVLFFYYLVQLNKEMADYHIHKVLDIAKERKLYWTIIAYYVFAQDEFEAALKDYDANFAQKISTICKNVYEQRKKNQATEGDVSIFAMLSRQDFELIIFALRGTPNKQIADYKGVSEVTISNRYSSLYDKLGVSNKSELKSYFIQSF